MLAYQLIATDRDLAEFRRKLQERNVRMIAMDFEGEFNLHEYGSRLCLIQVFDGTNYYIIDPFSISAEELKRTLEDRGVVKLFYGAESDRSLVFKQYGIRIKAMYDQKILVDLLELEHKGLDAVLGAVLGVESSKKKKYQMHNWTRRPIDGDALQYALSDVQYLFSLNKELVRRIQAANLVEALLLALVRQDDEVNVSGVPTILKSREYKDLRGPEKARFLKILEVREAMAKELNYPPNVVIAKEVLFLISKDSGNLELLRPDKRIGRHAIERLVASIRAIYGEAGSGNSAGA